MIIVVVPPYFYLLSTGLSSITRTAYQVMQIIGTTSAHPLNVRVSGCVSICSNNVHITGQCRKIIIVHCQGLRSQRC